MDRQVVVLSLEPSGLRPCSTPCWPCPHGTVLKQMESLKMGTRARLPQRPWGLSWNPVSCSAKGGILRLSWKGRGRVALWQAMPLQLLGLPDSTCVHRALCSLWPSCFLVPCLGSMGGGSDLPQGLLTVTCLLVGALAPGQAAGIPWGTVAVGAPAGRSLR